MQPVPPKRAGITYWLATPAMFVPASSENQPRFLKRKRDPLVMTTAEIQNSKYDEPQFSYRQQEDGDEYTFVSFRWKLGTDYNVALDTAESYQYRKCRAHLKRLQNPAVVTQINVPPATSHNSNTPIVFTSTCSVSNNTTTTYSTIVRTHRIKPQDIYKTAFQKKY